MKPLIIFLLTGSLALAADSALELARISLAKGWTSAVLFELSPEKIAALPNEAQTEARLLRARAQLESGHPVEARMTLQDERVASDPRTQSVLGDCYFAERNFAAAQVAYATAGSEAALGEARSWRALGQETPAVKLLSAIPLESPNGREAALELASIWLEKQNDGALRKWIPQMAGAFPSNDPRLEYLRGVLDLRQGELDSAREFLSEAAKDDGETGALAVIALSQVEVASGDPAGAEDVLEDYLRRTQGSRLSLRVLENLDALYERRGTSLSSDLRTVVEDRSNPIRARMALYFLARNEVRLGRLDSAKRAYEKFLAEPTGVDLQERAAEEYANLLIQDREFEKAVMVLQTPAISSTGRIRLKIAEAWARQGNYAAAEKEFLEQVNDPELGEDAAVNAAVCALLAGQPAAENAGLKLLQEKFPKSPQISRIKLWQARDAARQRQISAPDQLEKLARAGNAEAALNLAEWRLIEANYAESAKELARANELGADGERAAYLAVFLADVGAKDESERALLMAEDFIKRYSQSSYLPEVEFKRAEILYRSGDYVAARAAFSKLAMEYPASPLAGRSWLQAGQAGLKLMTKPALEQAREDLEEAAKSDPSLAPEARFQRALAENSLGLPKDAVTLYDNVIETQKDPELKYAALMEKGDTLYFLGKSDPAAYRSAIESWSLIATDPAASARWANQAYYKIGLLASTALNDQSAALKSFYAVLTRPQESDEEFFWYFKSGFQAAQILEKQKAWKEAIAIYNDLAKLAGPRAEEAKSRANQLRLKYLIWDD